MIKFRCRQCRQKIAVANDMAGKYIRCPDCGAKIKLPGAEELKEKIRNTRQPTAQKPAQIGQNPEEHLATLSILGLTSTEAPAEDTQAIMSMENGQESLIWSDDLIEKMQQAQEDTADAPCPACGLRVRANHPTCPQCDYSFAPDLSVFEPNVTIESADPKLSGFWRDMIYILTPFRSAGEAVTLFLILLLYTILELIPPFGPLVAMAKLPFYGYICAFLFHVMLGTANGDLDLPDMPAMSEMHDMQRALFQFFLSWFYACVPFFIVIIFYLRLMGPSRTVDFGNIFMVISIGMFLGMFFWPMIALSIALGDRYLVRPDKVLSSILRTLGPYCVCCVGIYLAMALNFSAASYLQSDDSHFLILELTLNLAGLLSMIYAMRAIGVLYKHYEHRLDW